MILNIDCEYILNQLDTDDHDFILNQQKVVVLEELKNIFGQLYIGGNNVIITDILFHVTHITGDQHMDVSKVQGLIFTILTEETLYRHSINIFDTEKENSSITISDYLSSHYGF